MLNYNSNRTTVTAGLSLSSIGFILFIVFLVLKLVGVLTISWFWVFFPLWAPLVLEILIVIVCVIILAILNR